MEVPLTAEYPERDMDEFSTCLSSLKEALKNGKENKGDSYEILRVLDSLIKASNVFKNEKLQEIDVEDIFLELLTHGSRQVVIKGAKTIAEIGKTANGREKCTNAAIVEAMIQLSESNEIDVLIQICRALGNICNDNDKGRKLVGERNGLKRILALLEKSANLASVEGADTLRSVAGGFLLNFLVDQENLLEKAIEEGSIDVISSILEMEDEATDDAKTHALLILGVFYDAGIQFLDDRLTKILVKILASDNSLELSEMCLEVLYSQADDEHAKVILAKAGVCELILDLLEKHGPRCTNEETRSVLKIACNLIVLILTGDESMNVLFDGSKGHVYKKLIGWLEDKDEDLLVTAVLAMGNFARTDKHSELIVSQGVDEKLLALVKEENLKKKSKGGGGDIRFQHALLSALRNLVIPVANKPIVFKGGLLIDLLQPMLDIPTFPVVFKLLGTLRIVIAGQKDAATRLGNKSEVVKKAVEWSCTEEHPGVKGEANRLLAWLIINSRDQQVISSLIRHGAVKHLVDMLLSRHALMQNEALLSLSILAAASFTNRMKAEADQAAERQLLEADVASNLCTFLENNTPHLDMPIFANAITLLEHFIDSETVADHLKTSSLSTVLDNFMKTRESDVANLADRIKTLCVSVSL